MDKKLQKQFQKQLEKTKKQLIKDLEGFAKKDPKLKGDWDTRFPQFGIHRSEQDENVSEVEQYSNLLPVEHTLELRLQDIERALLRIKKGTYGKCDKCGKEIELKRLKACPEAMLCMKCK
jgi:DnaK suppressor protein